jgi:mRNA interferase RelE/StbE
VKAKFRKSFERDLKKLKNNPRIRGQVREAIEEVEAVGGLRELPSARKLRGGSGEYYRLRVGDYRIGLELEGEVAVFVRCLHRREIYRYFP